MDGTLIYLNLPTSIEAIGWKKANIRTQVQENWRITIILTMILTIILTILTSGEKIALLLILKVKEEKM